MGGQADSRASRIRIRKARAADAPRLAALATQLGYPSTAGRVRRRLRSIGHRPDHAVAVAESPGGRVVAWVHVFAHRVLESEPSAELGGLVVDAEFRGQGAGQALVEWAERWAGARRLKAVYLRSNVIPKQAHSFYQKLGYRIVKTQHAFIKKL